MRKKILLLLLALIGLNTQAQIPSGYYNNATGKTGEELKIALHDIIKDHHVVSYAGLLDAFAYTDCKPNGKIWDIYSNYEYSLSGNCGEYEQEGDCWNREHTWPQSWFNQSSIPRSDLFHIYPTDGFVNGQRSNYPYGEVNNPTYTSGNGSKLGPCVTSGYSGKVFEPIDEYKGDIARGFFYMSVRYYGEDSGWTTSDMTNKSEIKDWAMTMLLRWSDQDPVSDKEIARNNAVYGYQNNRNPFIDHPEYAHMIWDENWQGGTSYNITCATGLSHGTVTAPENALEGSTVAITATPDPGYMVGTYSVYKTGSPSTTVNVSSNGTFTMPGYAVTVSASFIVNNTYYDITLGNVTHGSISTNTTSARSGTTITLSATPETGYSLYAWYVFKTNDMNTTVNVSGNTFVMPAFNVTVTASFVQGEISNGDYVKVTSAPSDWSGEYLIVYETGLKAFNGGLSTLDATNNTISITINNNHITSNTTTDAAKFTITTMTGGYSIQASSGKYIGNSSNTNGLTSNNTPVVNTLSFNQGNIDIISASSYLRYNVNSGQERFRYFKSSTYTNQKAIQLYKKTANTATPTHTIHFYDNGGEGSMNDQTVNEFEPTTLQANAFTKTGFVFDGWNTEADGTGDYYADGATVNLINDLTLYAQWIFVQNYQLVTSADQLEAGRIYLIVNVTNAKALGTTQNSNNRSASSVSIEDGIIPSIESSVCELTLGGSTGSWTFFDAGWGDNGGYLFAASSSANQLKTQESNNANGKWSITFGTNNSVTLRAQGTNNHNLLKYNNQNDIFSCYTSGQLDVCLFRRSELSDYQAEEIITQTAELSEGWNWFSTYIEMGDPIDLLLMLEESLGENGVLIKNADYYTAYEDGEWFGDLDDEGIFNEQMYKVLVGADYLMVLEGIVAKPENHAVILKQGWNWIGFPFNQIVPIVDALANFNAEEGDMIKTLDSNTSYEDGEWLGDLEDMTPGQGYMYWSKASENKTLTFSITGNQ